MLISELVSVNVHGAFHSDVQVSAYLDPESNLQLAKSYIFTSASAGHEVGSVELLETMVEAYLPGKTTNRLMAIATFGHGKSHFAVAAATFFGRPTGTAAYEGVLGGLKHAVVDSARLARLEKFKARLKPFLVVLLSGDEPGDLASKFSRALDEALSDHPETRGIRPPFWFTEAEQFLDRIAESQRDAADKVLKEQGLDLASLRDKVSKRDDAVYDVCRELFRSLTGTYPDFQGATSLKQLVEWATDELCGPGGPAGGVLILFDEFSTFVRTYGAGHGGRHASPLQDLLNGVQARRERVVFVAFGQVDPKTIAKEFAGARLDNIVKELDRIEDTLRLRSVLEDVLDSYLKQEIAWEQLLLSDPLRRAVEQSSFATWQLFARRYDKELHWSQKKLLERIGWGCFPMHPMTTALFSTIEYSATSNPRSVLQFVNKRLDKRAGQPALRGDQVNWILPSELVDYFGEMLDPRAWEQYQEVTRALSGDITIPQDLVLKSVLLTIAAKVPTRDLGFAEVAATFAGLATAEAREVLQELEDRGYLRRDPAVGSYGFWPVGGGVYRVEQVILRGLQRLPTVTEDVLAEVTKSLRPNGFLRPLEVPVQFGHPRDWMATQELLLAQSVGDPDQLRKIAASLSVDSRTLSAPRQTSERGALVWILAGIEGDVDWCRHELPRIVDEAFEDADVPIVLMRPTQTAPQVLELIRRVYVVEHLSREDIREVGQEQHTHARGAAISALGKALYSLRGTSEALVPRAFRGDLAALQEPSTDFALGVVYRRAFRDGPGEFFTSHGLSSSKFLSTVGGIAQALCNDSVFNQTALLGSDRVAKDIVDKVLVPKWGILGPGRRMQVPPADSPVHPGWQLLDETFPPGCIGKPVAPVLTRLLNSPYGYDPRTLTLLLSAWYGWHRHELSLSVNGTLTSVEKLLGFDPKLQKKATPFEFITLIGGAITRQDPAEIERDVWSILERIEQQTARFATNDATKALETLRQFAGGSRVNESTKLRIASAVHRIDDAVGIVRDYDAAAAKLLSIAGRWQTETPTRLIEAIREVKKLPHLTIVEAAHPGPTEIDRIVQEALTQRVEQLCRDFEHLADPAKFYAHQAILGKLVPQLREFPDLADRAKQAQQRLEESKQAADQQMAGERHDEQLRAEMSGMMVGADIGVATLQTYLVRIDTMQPFSEACRQEIAAKRQQVQTALDAIFAQVREIIGRLDHTNSGGEVREIRDEVAMLMQRVRESELEGEVVEAKDRCDALLEFFDKLESIAQFEPKTHEESQRAEARLSQLEHEDSALGGTHHALVVSSRERLTTYTCAQEDLSVRWLQSLGEKFDAGHDPWELDRLAQETRPFLPERERASLEEIRKRIRVEKDRDARRQIREIFEQIVDEQERKDIAREVWERAFGRAPIGVGNS